MPASTGLNSVYGRQWHGLGGRCRYVLEGLTAFLHMRVAFQDGAHGCRGGVPAVCEEKGRACNICVFIQLKA